MRFEGRKLLWFDSQRGLTISSEALKRSIIRIVCREIFPFSHKPFGQCMPDR
jgi:hypothetical protein